ncbi:DUF1707 domain-containing protein [Streptomonospora algeriensis]|uniref:DUF1707 domain-containing protein n=1 Tax=Streptomonospora algeriensis TaxID=995084 RepID=A0ABW3BHH9_9ACTN
MNETASAPVAGPANLRASDADRDSTAEVLAAALSEGRLTHEEHSERIEAAYAARTLAELEPLTTDLPESGSLPHPQTPDLARSPDGTENIRTVLAAAERKGRWLVEPRTNVSVLMGNAVLDLREATLAQREVTVQVAILMGTLDVIVPPGVRVVSRASEVLGTTSVDTDRSAGPAAPTVVITGSSWLSTIVAKTKEPKPVKAAKRKRGRL